ncbi:polysaccharide deacetylase family protein [Labilibaculum euxinus]
MKILTFDIEEWFHILDNDSTKTEMEWSNYEYRIHDNMERIFKILEKSGVSASFFVMGWMAEKFPEIIREIVDKGYEIGSHTHLHQLVYEQSPKEFKLDVERSTKTLEDISGQKVRFFRAPGFSITEQNLWAFEILHELGIEIDCSVFPAGRAHGGLKSYGTAEPSILRYNGIQLKELPINTHSILGKQFIYSGGGYFRLLPYSLIKYWSENDPYIMSYIHPRDLDPGQPMIKGLSLPRKFKSYVGIKKAEMKLTNWLSDFEFVDIKTADQIIDWKLVKIVNL